LEANGQNEPIFLDFARRVFRQTITRVESSTCLDRKRAPVLASRNSVQNRVIHEHLLKVRLVIYELDDASGKQY
jgi:hypothetical protein